MLNILAITVKQAEHSMKKVGTQYVVTIITNLNLKLIYCLF